MGLLRSNPEKYSWFRNRSRMLSRPQPLQQSLHTQVGSILQCRRHASSAENASHWRGWLHFAGIRPGRYTVSV